MDQPKIKVKPPENYEPINPTPVDANTSQGQEKTVGSMTQDEFLELLVKGVVQANRATKTLESLDDNEHELDEELNVFGRICRTTGDIGHGIVDIAEGVLRGAIDVTTFGKAKRK